MSAALFGLGSLILVVISQRSLRRPHTHGFYRFFAWEAILGLFVLNAAGWFTEPFSWHQIISWAFLTVCILPLVLGLVMLRQGGSGAQDVRDEPELFNWERTTKLVQGGIFGVIRHPLYTSLLLLAVGIFFKAPSAMGASLAAAASGFLILTAKAEEAECLRTFGPAYRDYMHRTRMFIPFLI